jgi:hypothetical protein
MAKAGFVYTGTVLAADGVTTEPSAQCFVCQHEMVWDQATDHPM